MSKKGTYTYKNVEKWSKKAGSKVDLITRLDRSFYLYARLFWSVSVNWSACAQQAAARFDQLLSSLLV